MNRKSRLLLVPLAATAVTGLLAWPSLRKLPHADTGAPDGYATLEAAVEACRATGLQGWPLVTYAQRLVTRQYRHYTVRNLFDTPERSFARRMGYCTQYNLALKEILDRLGFATRAVYALRVAVTDDPSWQMGHTWLRVRVDGESRDVCAGRLANVPGAVNFQPLTRVLAGNRLLFTLYQATMIPFCGILEWRALLTGKPAPDWMFKEFGQ